MEEENQTYVAYLVKNKQKPRPKQILYLMMRQSSSAGKTELQLAY